MSSWVGSGRAWLGVELEATDADEAGVRVLRVIPGSPAHRARLAAGDVLLRIDNEAVALPSDVVSLVSRQQAGTRVALMLRRSGKERLVGVRLGSFPEGDQLMRMSFVGRAAPAFDQLKTARGSLTPALGALRGQVLVVEFWAPWCVACRALTPVMNDWHARYAAQGLRVIGVANERVARAARYAEQLGMEFSIFADESGRTMRAYQALAVPTVFVIDRAGTVREVMVGYDAQRLRELDALVTRLVAEP